jgi:hypothetical protein
VITRHLLETENYRERFYDSELAKMAEPGGFRVVQ